MSLGVQSDAVGCGVGARPRRNSLRIGRACGGAAAHGGGGYAEFVIADEARAYPIPSALSFAVATVVTCHFPAAFSLANAAVIREGEWVLVMGAAGALGSAAVQVAKLYGAQVIAAASLLFLLLSQYLANRLIGLSSATYLAALARPVLLVACVLAVLWLARPLLPGPPLAVLTAGTALGIIATLAALPLIAGDLCRTYWKSVRGT